MEVRSRFKGLDLTDRVPDELWNEVRDTVQEAVIKTFPKKKKCKKAKFRLKSKKIGKITRPFRYDLNQIPYDYTVEVRNRFKGLDLRDRVPDEL